MPQQQDKNPFDKTIKVRDTRKMDMATGYPVTDKTRKHAEIPYDYVQMIIEEAKKHGVDPYTAIAIGIQETGFKKDSITNPFMLGNFNPYGSIIKQSVQFMAEKNKYAKNLGKKTDEEVIQAYNGYGKIRNAGKMYGIDTNTVPIDMNENPVYGKRVVNLRDSVVMKNPEIRNLVEGKTPIKYKDGGNVVQQLKCGGKKKKKMALGGDVGTEGAFMRTPDGLTNIAGGTSSSGPGIPYAMLGEIAGEGLNSIITSGIPSETDSRENPQDFLKKRDNLTTAGGIAKNTAVGAGIGASIGSIVPVLGTGVGAAVGAGVGALVTGAKELFMSKKKKEARADDLQDWQQGWAKDYAMNTAKAGYKEGGKKGGKIKGEGGPKEDAIEKNVSDGSFIVPSENAEQAMDLGKNYLGWKGDETANRKYPGTEVAVSNGEVLFTPEEVDILRYHGLDLNRLAPNAKPGDKMAKGGWKYDNESEGYYFDQNAQGDDPGAKEWVEANNPDHSQDTRIAIDAAKAIGFASMNGAGIGSATGGNADAIVDPNAEIEQGPLGKIASVAPEIAGALQMIAGTVGLAKAGRMPDINVSESLRDITMEARKEAQYGLEPGVMSAMENKAEKARRDTTNAIVARGGTANEVNSNLQNTLSNVINSKYDIELANAAEKNRKKSTYYGLKTKMADQEMDIAKMGREDWLQIQEVNAGLLNAGISNIVGARKLKATMDMMKKTGSSSADISKIV